MPGKGRKHSEKTVSSFDPGPLHDGTPIQHLRARLERHFLVHERGLEAGLLLGHVGDTGVLDAGDARHFDGFLSNFFLRVTLE